VAAIWIVMIGMSTGAVAAFFPNSITIDSGRVYIWASQMSDTLASLTLILIVLVACLRVRGRSESDIASPENDDIAETFNSTNLTSTPTDLGAEERSNSDERIGVNLARPRLIVKLAVIVGIVLLASALEQVLGGNHFNTSTESSAVSLSENNQILPALEATLRELPRDFSPSAYQQYYLASGWASDIGATGTATNLDEQLVRASIDLRNPVGLVVGLNQYSVEDRHSISESVRRHMLTTIESRSWRITVEAAFQWQMSGNASALIGDLEKTSRNSSPSIRQDFQTAIALVESYENAA
jgi:hypothetical protein